MRYFLIIVGILYHLTSFSQSNTFPSSGNVGIGTSSPERNLHITSGNSGDAIFRIEADADNNNENDNPYLEFFQDGRLTRAEIGYLNDNFFGISHQGSLSGITRPSIRFGIDLNGNIGMGTTTPSERLSIFNNSAIQVASQYSNSNTGQGSGNGFLVGIETSGNGLVWNRENNFIRFGTNSVERLRILADGKVGIGTTTPATKLDVNGAITISTSESTIFQVTNSLVQSFILSNDDIIGVNKLTINDDGMGEGIDWLNGRSISVYTTSQGGFNGFRFGTTSMFPYVFEGGNVGIGNSNPTEKLVVDGKILAEEVKVQTVPASDYVFETDYNLLSLQQVEFFIQQNKHLPDIPSAEEFKKNGVGLGEMDDLLLRKIEELTLYIIEMKKENEHLRSDVEILKNRLNHE